MSLGDLLAGERVEVITAGSSRYARSLLLLGLHDSMVVSVAGRTRSGAVLLTHGEERLCIPAYLADSIICRRISHTRVRRPQGQA